MLADLPWHWCGAYRIDYGHGRWTATRGDTRAVLAAEAADELRGLILADYTARPVPRDHGRRSMPRDQGQR